MEIVGVKHRLDGLEKSMEAIKPTTAELERVRDRVLFAGLARSSVASEKH